jgi:hypothetical protein
MDRSDGCDSSPIAALPADREHGFQLAGKHGWVSAVVTGICWRVILR